MFWGNFGEKSVWENLSKGEGIMEKRGCVVGEDGDGIQKSALKLCLKRQLEGRPKMKD